MLFRFYFMILSVSSLFFSSCQPSMTEDEINQIGITTCRVPAPFIKQLGFDPTKSFFSTEVPGTKGLGLVQSGRSLEDSINYRYYQHPSWSQFGYMGCLTTDNEGNAFTCPIPFVNTIGITQENINRIYKVDNITGIMSQFIQLPIADSVEGMLPFGALGIYYDCHANKIYVASVAGSSRDIEKGIIYVINKETGKIEDQLNDVDAMGLCVGGITGTKKLYFGSARTSDIYSIELSKEGHFIGKQIAEFSLDQLGPRGDDKARRLRFDQLGKLHVHGVEFNFSLAAHSQKPETEYVFTYFYNDKNWVPALW